MSLLIRPAILMKNTSSCPIFRYADRDEPGTRRCHLPPPERCPLLRFEGEGPERWSRFRARTAQAVDAAAPGDGRRRRLRQCPEQPE